MPGSDCSGFLPRQYAEAGALDSADRGQQGGLEAAEQGLLWHEDSKPGTLV